MQGLALVRQSFERGFAEKAVVQDLDWDALSKLIHSDEGKRELGALRNTFFDIKQRMESESKQLGPPDWAHWSKEIDPKLVDGFKKAFEGMKVPKYEGDNVAQASAKFAELIKEAEVLAASSAARVKEIHIELEKLQKAKERITTATIDDELAADAKMAEDIDRELGENNFLVRS